LPLHRISRIDGNRKAIDAREAAIIEESEKLYGQRRSLAAGGVYLGRPGSPPKGHVATNIIQFPPKAASAPLPMPSQQELLDNIARVNRGARQREEASTGEAFTRAALSIYAAHASSFIALGYSPIARFKSNDGGGDTYPKASSDYCAAVAPEDLRKRWGQTPGAGVALACGYQGLVCIDIDTDLEAVLAEVRKVFAHCRIGRFGSKGFALLARYEGENEKCRFKNIYDPAGNTLVEIKGNGQNLTVPPSLHAKTGKAYFWFNPHTGETFDELPAFEELPVITDADLERLRAALAPWARPARPPRAKSGPGAPKPSNKRMESYARGGFTRAQSDLAKAAPGGRNRLLFESVCSLGWAVHHGFIPKREFIGGFTDACSVNKLCEEEGRHAIEATVESGLAFSESDDLPLLVEKPAKRKRAASTNSYADPDAVPGEDAPNGGGGGEHAEALKDDARPQANPAPGLSLKEDFYAVLPQHQYLCVPTRALWPAASINGRFGKGAAQWLDENRPAEAMTWAPGKPLAIEDQLICEGGWIDRQGCRTLNLYRPPVIKDGRDPDKAGQWLDHVRRIYPDGYEHLIDFLAHRVQRPQEKINHALVLGGAPGIGKDTILEPVKHAVGPWNFAEVSPRHILGRFNGFRKSVILRISEACDLGDFDRNNFYESMKTLAASPPDVLLIDEKNIREYPIPNVLAAIITTNHRTDSLYLPPDDRRHHCLWSDCKKEHFSETYWNKLWGWYTGGGLEHVAAFLRARDLSGFNPKKPPEKTEAFWAICDNGRSPEEGEFHDALEGLGWPAAITLDEITNSPTIGLLGGWLTERKNARAIPHKFEACGYIALRNTGTTDGRWKIGGKNKVVYVRKELSREEKYEAVECLRRQHGGS
jgi:hypothetical protein